MKAIEYRNRINPATKPHLLKRVVHVYSRISIVSLSQHMN